MENTKKYAYFNEAYRRYEFGGFTDSLDVAKRKAFHRNEFESHFGCTPAAVYLSEDVEIKPEDKVIAPKYEAHPLMIFENKRWKNI